MENQRIKSKKKKKYTFLNGFMRIKVLMFVTANLEAPKWTKYQIREIGGSRIKGPNQMIFALDSNNRIKSKS